MAAHSHLTKQFIPIKLNNGASIYIAIKKRPK